MYYWLKFTTDMIEKTGPQNILRQRNPIVPQRPQAAVEILSALPNTRRKASSSPPKQKQPPTPFADLLEGLGIRRKGKTPTSPSNNGIRPILQQSLGISQPQEAPKVQHPRAAEWDKFIDNSPPLQYFIDKFRTEGKAAEACDFLQALQSAYGGDSTTFFVSTDTAKTLSTLMGLEIEEKGKLICFNPDPNIVDPFLVAQLQKRLSDG